MYRNYMAMCGYTLNKSFAENFGGNYISARYDDIINPKPVETRSAAEIIADISAKLDKLGKE